MVAMWCEQRPERCVECGGRLTPLERFAEAEVCDLCRIEALGEAVALLKSDAATEARARRLAEAEARGLCRPATQRC